jgi:hypothetical protein
MQSENLGNLGQHRHPRVACSYQCTPIAAARYLWCHTGRHSRQELGNLHNSASVCMIAVSQHFQQNCRCSLRFCVHNWWTYRLTCYHVASSSCYCAFVELIASKIAPLGAVLIFPKLVAVRTPIAGTRHHGILLPLLLSLLGIYFLHDSSTPWL